MLQQEIDKIFDLLMSQVPPAEWIELCHQHNITVIGMIMICHHSYRYIYDMLIMGINTTSLLSVWLWYVIILTGILMTCWLWVSTQHHRYRYGYSIVINTSSFFIICVIMMFQNMISCFRYDCNHVAKLVFASDTIHSIAIHRVISILLP